MKRICKVCKELKNIENFPKRESGYRYKCKVCTNKSKKKYRDRPGVRYKEVLEARKYRKQYWNKHYESIKRWRKNNPEKYLACAKRSRDKIKKTIKGRLDHRISCLLYRSLKKQKAGKRWQEIVGYSTIELKEHLEKQFIGEMNWENFLEGKIHIDHIRPLSSFEYKSPDDKEFKECWTLENLQPLWAKDNLKKGAKYDKGD